MKLPRTPNTEQWIHNLLNGGFDLKRFFLDDEIGSLVKGEYLHWDQLRHLVPPAGVNHEEWWAAISIKRFQSKTRIPLKDKVGRNFVFANLRSITRDLHTIDMNVNTAGESSIYDKVSLPDVKEQFYFSTLIQESITSSQLEGAATTRRDAKEFLVDRRKPRSRSEQMILNNFFVMKKLKTLKNEPLTKELVFEVHRTVTENTLDTSDGCGRFRRPDEVVLVYGNDDNVYHTPPCSSELEGRMEEMCTFANETKEFIHPAIRSIMLHFWMGYDHPFLDGNGRTARALFYWSMLRNNYWSFEYISISQILLEAPAQYARAFLYTETDSNDLTYFILHQLSVIRKAEKALVEYVQSKSQEKHILHAQFHGTRSLNKRQRNLVSSALKDPFKAFTIQGHQQIESVSYQTARNDLVELKRRGLFRERDTSKRPLEFLASPDLEQRLKRDG